MYIHVCIMYRALCTDLQILVHVVRIPDAWLARLWIKLKVSKSSRWISRACQCSRGHHWQQSINDVNPQQTFNKQSVNLNLHSSCQLEVGPGVQVNPLNLSQHSDSPWHSQSVILDSDVQRRAPASSWLGGESWLWLGRDRVMSDYIFWRVRMLDPSTMPEFLCYLGDGWLFYFGNCC